MPIILDGIVVWEEGFRGGKARGKWCFILIQNICKIITEMLSFNKQLNNYYASCIFLYLELL